MKDQRRTEVKTAYVMAGNMHKLSYVLTPQDKQVVLQKVMEPKVAKVKAAQAKIYENLQRFTENLFGQKVMNMYREAPEMFKRMPEFLYTTDSRYGKLSIEINIDVPSYYTPKELIKAIKESDMALKLDKEIEQYYMMAEDLVSKQEFAKNVLAKTTTLLHLIETQPIKYYDALVQYRQPSLAPQPVRKRRNNN